MDLAHLLTEQHRPELADLDRRDTISLVRLMAEDQAEALDALVRAAPQIASAIDTVVERLEDGGRLVYVGAGTAGRMGVLDAAECPPTFNTDLVIGVLAGGFDALLKSSEAVEDDAAAGAADMDRLGVSARDAVVGVSASGRTPYTIGAVQQARRLGARDDRRCLQPRRRAEPPRRSSARARRRPRGHRRIDPAEGRHGAEGRAQHVLDDRHGAAGQDLRRT